MSLKRKDNMLLYTDTLQGEQVCRDDLWAISTEELKALYHRLAAEAVGVKVLSDDAEFEYDDAITISKLKELLEVAE